MARATQSELLEQRIAENTAAQQVDLATWIFERAPVQRGERVLELCCGTGGQTLALLERVGENGHVVGLDVSQSALDTLAARAGATSERLTCVRGKLEDFPSALDHAGANFNAFDLIFCAYGLYYSGDVERTLSESKAKLKGDGRIVVVGPFGPNNKPLFDVVRASGVEISEPVIYSSELFMTKTVIPWGARNFETLSVSTMVNPVRWNSVERVVNYWKNTTFFDESRLEAFQNLIKRHFERETVFMNEKWVMLVEMSHART